MSELINFGGIAECDGGKKLRATFRIRDDKVYIGPVKKKIDVNYYKNNWDCIK